MADQPEALRLAQELDAYHTRACHKEAADELRRLSVSEREGWRYADELEQERKRLKTANEKLLEALRRARDGLAGGWWDYGPGQYEHDQCNELIEVVDATIAKHGGSHD